MKQKNGHRLRWLLYVTAIFVSALVYEVGQLYGDQRMYIDQRDYPGGPLAWALQKESDPPGVIGQGGGLVSLALSDALLVCISRPSITHCAWEF